MDDFTKAILYPTTEDIQHWEEARKRLKEMILSIEDISDGFRAEINLDLTFLSLDK